MKKETCVLNVRIMEGQKETILKHSPKFSDFIVSLSFIYPDARNVIKIKRKTSI